MRSCVVNAENAVLMENLFICRPESAQTLVKNKFKDGQDDSTEGENCLPSRLKIGVQSPRKERENEFP